MTPALSLAKELNAPQGEVHGPKIVPMACERQESGMGSKAILDKPGWLFELKLDGVRIVADKKDSRVLLTYRRLRDASEYYPEVCAALAKLDEERVVLDGEIVAFDEKGRPDFQLLAQRFTASPKRTPKVPVVYAVFDVLAIGPYDLRVVPLEARKEILKRVVPEESSGILRHHPTFEQGLALYDFCDAHDLEGVVAKRKGSTYKPGERSTDWYKIKRQHDAELVIVGWTERQGVLRALDVASMTDGVLVYRGKVGTGMNAAMLEAMLPLLKTVKTDKPTATGPYSPPDVGVVRHHCRPELVVSVRFFMASKEGILRSLVFHGLRPDVDPKDCVLPTGVG
jgi:bifunctional non-homologous end joining protein LigD